MLVQSTSDIRKEGGRELYRPEHIRGHPTPATRQQRAAAETRRAYPRFSVGGQGGGGDILRQPQAGRVRRSAAQDQTQWRPGKRDPYTFPGRWGQNFCLYSNVRKNLRRQRFLRRIRAYLRTGYARPRVLTTARLWSGFYLFARAVFSCRILKFMNNEIKTYNPFKMWGSWAGLFLGFVVLLSWSSALSSRVSVVYGFLKYIIYLNPVYYLAQNQDIYLQISLLITLPVVTFVYGWGIHSLFRKFLR